MPKQKRGCDERMTLLKDARITIVTNNSSFEVKMSTPQAHKLIRFISLWKLKGKIDLDIILDYKRDKKKNATNNLQR